MPVILRPQLQGRWLSDSDAGLSPLARSFPSPLMVVVRAPESPLPTLLSRKRFRRNFL